MSVRPEDFSRRSPIYRELAKLGARFGEVAGCAAPMRFSDEVEQETAQARELGLSDLFALPRGGYKGWDNAGYLGKHGIAAGEPTNEASNIAYPQADGSLIARLAASEVLILGNLEGASEVLRTPQGAWSMEAGEGAYPVPRPDTNCWFLASGRHAAAMFAKICGVDLRPTKFANHRVAQTSVARLNSIVVRADLGSVYALHLLTDSASAGYMWDCLLDAAEEFGGRPVGLEALRALARG